MSTTSKTGSTVGPTKDKSIDKKIATFNKYVDKNINKISDKKLDIA